MPKNDEGEFELVLGNRQLLSVFFIVVILLGVFFTMGYIVGRNSGPLTADVAQKTDAAPVVVDAPPHPAESPAQTPPAGAMETEPPQPVSTQPQRPADAAPASPPTPAKAEPARNVPPKPAASNEPAAGQSYLQLAATSKREADIMVDVLRQKGFIALAAEIAEKPGTYRVLVGPVTDATANKTRADLQGAGFPGNAAIRRTF